MGAFASLSAYRAALEAPRESIIIPPNNIFPLSGARLQSLWTANFGPGLTAGVAPTTAVVPTNATTGALGQTDAAAEQLYLVGGSMSMAYAGSGSVVDSGAFILCDRLSHQGGLSGITTGAQTTNLPTAALSRYTSGVGVMMALEIYSSVGATATTVTTSYTNQAGTAARASTATTFGGTNFNSSPRFVVLPLASGDTGVRSVESVTLAATTGTAGNFGVTLFRPLAMLAPTTTNSGTQALNLLDGGLVGGLPEVLDGACLFFTRIMVTGNSYAVAGDFRFAAV